jgi:hypothetical protein
VGFAFDIKEQNGIGLQIRGGDSIKLVLDIAGAPAAGGHKYYVGLWNDDSLQWHTLGNSALSADGKTVSAFIAHFSRYAVLTRSVDLMSTLSVLPNPFSPDKSASEFESLALRLGRDAPKGTCISFSPDVSEQRLDKIKIRIYNLVGDQMASVVMQNIPKMIQYQLWWDGRTTDRDINWDELKPHPTIQNAKIMAGNKMCRNGRYFVVLTIRDAKGKEKNYKKQVVLIK